MSDRRPTEHKDVEVPTDPIARAQIEARNGLIQYDHGVRLVMEAIERRAFRLRPSTLLGLHREALQGLTTFAGSFRPSDVTI